MDIEVTNPEIQSEASIEAALRGQGLYFLKFDVPPVENTAHWHSFNSIFYITSGTLFLTDGDGVVHEAGPGARVSVPAETLHAERSAGGYSILLGVSRDPSTFEDQVNLPPETLPDRRG